VAGWSEIIDILEESENTKDPMSPEKEEKLIATYTAFIQLCFHDFPIENSPQVIDQHIMGYGTHIDEKIMDIKSFNDLLELQRRESAGLEMKVSEVPVTRKVLGNGDVALFVDEIHLAMQVDGAPVEIHPRVTTLMEYRNDNWYAVHFHGSFAQGSSGDEDTWSVNELKRRTEELERTVAERTEELKESLENLKAAQGQLIHAEKMASLGELTAGIAHEIQNPLNFVNNFSEVSNELIEEMQEALEGGDLEEVRAISKDLGQNLEKINVHGKRADSIVKSMLQHSRSNAGQLEPTDINALCDECLRLAYHGMRAREKAFNVEMETAFDPKVREVGVVPQDIGRVLLNLMSNAFQAVHAKHLSAPEGYQPRVTVSTEQTDEGIQISIADNGPGIPEDFRDKIFQPFFTTKPTGQGTGLGLSISREIITKGHGGDLRVVSTPGNGSVFVISLPVTKGD
jgi:signal transduction histidine kinase